MDGLPLSPHLATDLLVCAWALALARVDIRERRLPRKLTLPAYVIGTALLVAAVTTGGGAQALPQVAPALAGAIALRLVYAAARALSPGGAALGRGDVTLSAPLGGWLGWHGWEAWLLGAWSGFAISGLVAATLLLTKRVGKHTPLPHGPPMLLGALLAASATHAA
ncbi:MAG: A24 family peptidase [Dermatophilus congolensis]|nr:A24 family peptidase [Dermatophilus congolensis]